MRIRCLAKTVRRVRKRLAVLCKHDEAKYGRSYEAYRGYFVHAVPERGIEKYVRRS